MGQNESKGQQGVVPFENYQGPPLGPPPMSAPGLVTAQYNQSGGRVVAPRGMPRRGPFGPPPDRSVVNGPGYAQQLREGMMVEAAQDTPWFRSRPPPQSSQSQPPPSNRQPYIKTVRTVINEPRGYQPPTQSQSYQQGYQSYQAQSQPQSYQVQAQPQSYHAQAQPQTYQVQAQPQQAQQVMYYDPKTGALTSGGQQQVATAMPVACGTQACAVPQVIGYQQPQVLGYQAQPQVAYQAAPQMVGYQQPAQPVMYAYPQQQQAQPIVVPGQLYTATGGVQQLG